LDGYSVSKAVDMYVLHYVNCRYSPLTHIKEKEIKNTKFTTEIRAGLTTFFTMAYIIAVNVSFPASMCMPSPLTPERPRSSPTREATVYAMTPPAKIQCATTTWSMPLAFKVDCSVRLQQPSTDSSCRLEPFSDHGNCCHCRLQFVSVWVSNKHARVSCVSHINALSIFSETLADFTRRPGMGLNAYFAYQVVGFRGQGFISYNLALTAVFVEGFVFVALSLIGMRQWLVKVIPVSLKIASACGIGLFLAEIGLSYSAGIGAITGGKNTPLEVGGCPLEYLEDGVCTSHKMTNPTVSASRLL
jgi:AGZA family xanthine/uracil permease-like MFS transporter